MNDQYLKEWMETVERRLEALEGKARKETPPAPPPTAPTSYPRWIYRRSPSTGEVEAMLVKTEDQLPPEGEFADSPADLEEIEIEQAISEPEEETEPEVESVAEDDPDLEIPHRGAPKPEGVEIPEDWREMHHSTRIKLAKLLPGGEDVTSNDDAIALIELELERRGNAD